MTRSRSSKPSASSFALAAAARCVACGLAQPTCPRRGEFLRPCLVLIDDGLELRLGFSGAAELDRRRRQGRDGGEDAIQLRHLRIADLDLRSPQKDELAAERDATGEHCRLAARIALRGGPIVARAIEELGKGFGLLLTQRGPQIVAELEGGQHRRHLGNARDENLRGRMERREIRLRDVFGKVHQCKLDVPELTFLGHVVQAGLQGRCVLVLDRAIVKSWVHQGGFERAIFTAHFDDVGQKR
jgi:hypothetical protein